MPILGISTRIRTATAPVAVTNEPTTAVVAGTSYRITSAARRVVDPTAAITVKVDADGAGAGGYATAGATTYSVDALHGIITFSPAIAVGAFVTVDYSYLPTIPVADCNSVSLTCSRESKDVTVFHDTNVHKKKQQLVRTATGSVGGYVDLLADQDAGAGVVSIHGLFSADTEALLEIDFGKGLDPALLFRAWVQLDAQSTDAAHDGVVEGGFTWECSERDLVGRTDKASFGWGQ